MSAALRRLYAGLPRIDCKRLCGEACGVIAMGRREWWALRDGLAAEPPHDQMGDLFVMHREDLSCPLLTAGGLCSAHRLRPMVCRLYGLVDDPKMRCPHGCVPERWLTPEEGHELLRRAGS